MFQTLTFAVISTALAANCFAAGYSLDFSARSVDESSVPKSLCAGDTLSLKVSDSVSYTLTIADELPRFGESRPFSAHLGDGARTATAILRKDGLFVEIRDIARAKLVRATVRGAKVQVEEIDLSNSSRGGCIEVEAPADAVESGAYTLAVAIDSAKVAAPEISGGESSASGDEAFVLTEGEDGASISLVIENAVKGLWYGYEVKDALGDEVAFENDVDSFTRATGARYRLKASTPRPAKSSGFFRVKALPANPIRSNR